MTVAFLTCINCIFCTLKPPIITLLWTTGSFKSTKACMLDFRRYQKQVIFQISLVECWDQLVKSRLFCGFLGGLVLCPQTKKSGLTCWILNAWLHEASWNVVWYGIEPNVYITLLLRLVSLLLRNRGCGDAKLYRSVKCIVSYIRFAVLGFPQISKCNCIQCHFSF